MNRASRSRFLSLCRVIPLGIVIAWPLVGLAAGDAARGKQLYGVCSTCLGDRGQGMPDMNGPALAGREAWYLKRQIQNFKSGARGGDSRDIYGQQMAPMAQLLADDQAIDDVLAYIDTLE